MAPASAALTAVYRHGRKGGRSQKPVVKRDYQSGALNLKIRFRPTMPVEEARNTLVELPMAEES